MHALANEFIEVEIKRLERILAGVRARQGEEVLDDMLQPLSFLAESSQRLAVSLLRAFLLRQGNLRFPAQDGYRGAQLVGGIRNESSLAVEGLIEAIEQLIEGPRQLPEFVPRILHLEAFVEILRTDAARLCTHHHHWRETSPRQKIPAHTGEKNRQGNNDPECFCQRFEKFVLPVQRLQNEQRGRLLVDRKMPHVAPVLVLPDAHGPERIRRRYKRPQRSGDRKWPPRSLHPHCPAERHHRVRHSPSTEKSPRVPLRLRPRASPHFDAGRSKERPRVR